MRLNTGKRTPAVLLAAGLVLGLGACGDDGDGDDASAPVYDDGSAVTTAGGGSAEPDTGATSETTAAAGDAADSDGIVIADFAFNSVTVAAGASVSVINEDNTSHTVTSDDGAFDATLGGGESGEFTAPSEPGEYPYYCEIHRSMTGTLTVA